MLINPYTIVLQLINIAILFYFLKRFLFKPLQSFLEKRREHIKEQFKEAERKKLESQKLYDEYKKRIETSQQEIRLMIKGAQEEAENTRRHILEQARQEAREFIQKAREQLEREKNIVSRELLEQSLDFSLAFTSKVLEQKISKKEHHEIIRQIMDRMGETKWVQ